MGNAAEELAIRHQRDRDEALRNAVPLANQIAALMYEVRHLGQFKGLDFDDVQRLLNNLRALQAEVIAEDRAYRDSMAKAGDR